MHKLHKMFFDMRRWFRHGRMKRESSGPACWSGNLELYPQL